MFRKTLTVVGCLVATCCFVGMSNLAQAQKSIPRPTLKSYHPAPRGMTQQAITGMLTGQASSVASASSDPVQLTHWNFRVESSRDGKTYSGLMVGNRALEGGSQPSSISTQIVPVIVKTVALGTAVDLNTGAITIETGNENDETTFNPVAADGSCLVSPNSIPAKVFSDSPLFHPADFNFGGTDMGFTQATDAFQRANFWNTIDRNNYHVLLGPVKTLSALTLRVPAPENGVGGLALDLPNLIPGICGRIGLVDINTIDNFVTSQFAPLAAKGVNPSTFPIFMFYNTAFPIGDPTNFGNCCAGGYHNAVNVGTEANPVAQTYSPLDFDMTGFFINFSGSGVLDSEIASHEVAEWMDDPLGANPTPAWGNTGQVQGFCQENLEDGDPLTGFEVSRIFMPNGFTYHLQELAFFSWFYGAINGGAPSIGLHGWFSDNATFLTNAGPVCKI